MMCEECKKRTACVHVTKIINSQKQEKHLCEQCAREASEMNFSIDNNLSVHDFLKDIFKHCVIEEAHPEAEAECPHCGMVYSEFSRNGKIGCSACYAGFSEQLEPLVRRIHGASVHTGKTPQRGVKWSVKLRIRQLRQELEKHVLSEQYEQAATIRDEIRSLEKTLAVQSGGE